MQPDEKFLKRYMGKRAMIQLSKERQMFTVTYGGERTVRGEQASFLSPATLQAADGDKQLVGYSDIIPDCEIVDYYGAPTDPREAIIVRVTDAAGAEIEYDIPTCAIEYIVTIVKAPSRLAR
jgi:hypothetical protein